MNTFSRLGKANSLTDESYENRILVGITYQRIMI
jgi:hypothetical protein